jgi:voltage-gated potassium channel
VSTPLVGDPEPRRTARGEQSTPHERARWSVLLWAHQRLEPVFIALSVLWLVLVVADLVLGRLPEPIDVVVWVIWGLFIAEYAVGLMVAPDRRAYVRVRWLTALSLVLPAFRILRAFAVLRFLGAARLLRSLGLLRVLTSLNRGATTLRRVARMRGLGYLVTLTALVIVIGSAGMAAFEPGLVRSAGSSALAAYEGALWWTAYAMTSGPPTQPASTEGRLLGWLLSLYGLAVFGYLTATLASHFIGQDRTKDAGRATSQPAGSAPPSESAASSEVAQRDG